MGNICCSCFCCCSEKNKREEETGTLEQELNKAPITEMEFNMSSSDKQSDIQSTTGQTEVKDIRPKVQIEDNKASFKDGKMDYTSSEAKRRSKKKSKTTTPSQKVSKEFKIVKNFLDKKDYNLIETIGSGNYAQVYKAFHRTNRKTVAVKVIDLSKTEEHYRSNFLPNEVTVMQTCKHHNIIKIYQLIQTKNRVVMVMEFAPRGTLADWLQDKGPLSEFNAHLCFAQIVDAIHCLHSNRIAHRDLKLENILLTENYDPKISDFSYATKFEPNDPLCKLFCGSLPYFAPEILQRKPLNPLISDIWSLGVCFYIMLNDTLPFNIGDDKKMLTKQLNKDWRFRSRANRDLSVELKTMIARMLEPDVTLRVTAQQLIEDPWIKQ